MYLPERCIFCLDLALGDLVLRVDLVLVVVVVVWRMEYMFMNGYFCFVLGWVCWLCWIELGWVGCVGLD